MYINGVWPSLVGRLDGVQEVAGSNPVIPTIRVCSSVVEHVVDIHGAESSILSTPTIGSLSEMDITEVYETSSPSSTLGETANYFRRLLRRRRGVGKNLLGFCLMRK